MKPDLLEKLTEHQRQIQNKIDNDIAYINKSLCLVDYTFGKDPLNKIKYDLQDLFFNHLNNQ